jgi:hypothetical protein
MSLALAIFSSPLMRAVPAYVTGLLGDGLWAKVLADAADVAVPLGVSVVGVGLIALVMDGGWGTSLKMGSVMVTGWLAGAAILIAGRGRAEVGGEWRAHLSGETGAGMAGGRQVREAAGFVVAAVRFRVQDGVDLVWRPADVVLASRELSSLVVLVATLGVSMVFIRRGGLGGLADHLEAVGVAWGAAVGLIRAGREWRGVKLAERKPRRKAE